MAIRTSRHSVVAISTGGQAFSTSVRDHTVATDQPSGAGGSGRAHMPGPQHADHAPDIVVQLREHAIASDDRAGRDAAA
jgi:hypothetical protein